MNKKMLFLRMPESEEKLAQKRCTEIPMLGKQTTAQNCFVFSTIMLIFAARTTITEISPMPNTKIKGSLTGIVDKMNATYEGFIGGFSLGINRRVVPVMTDGAVSGWKMQRCENDVWVDLDETPFETMEELIAYYKGEDRGRM